MEQQKIIDEINYYKAQAITELLYANTTSRTTTKQSSRRIYF